MGILSSARLLLAGGKPRGKHDSKLAGSPPLRPRVPRNPRLWLEGLPYLPKLGRPIVISFMGKGGTGKTTSAVFIATIASWLGHRVWVLDLDPQKSASIWWGRRKNPEASGATAKMVVHRCASRNLRRALDVARREGVDLVVIDNPPRRHEHTIEIAGSADLVVLTCVAALFDIEETLSWLDFLRQNAIEPYVVLGNAAPRRDDTDSPLTADARLALMRRRRGQHTGQPTRLWAGQATRRHAVIRAVATGSAIIETEPSGASAVEFRKLWTSLVQQLKEPKR